MLKDTEARLVFEHPILALTAGRARPLTSQPIGYWECGLAANESRGGRAIDANGRGLALFSNRIIAFAVRIAALGTARDARSGIERAGQGVRGHGAGGSTECQDNRLINYFNDM